MKKEKKRDKQLIKKDIFVYAEMMDEPVLREDKNYIIAGCYNEDKTKFENIITGEIYNIEVKNDLDNLNINGRNMSIIFNDGMTLGGMYWSQHLRTKNNGGFDWFRIGYELKHTSVPGIDVPASLSLNLKYMHEFFVNKKQYDEIDVKDIKKMINYMNKFSHKIISKELEKREELVL